MYAAYKLAFGWGMPWGSGSSQPPRGHQKKRREKMMESCTFFMEKTVCCPPGCHLCRSPGEVFVVGVRFHACMHACTVLNPCGQKGIYTALLCKAVPDASPKECYFAARKSAGLHFSCKALSEFSFLKDAERVHPLMLISIDKALHEK